MLNSKKLQQIDFKLKKLSQPQPIGAKRSGDTSVLRSNNQAEQERLTIQRDQALQLVRCPSRR